MISLFSCVFLFSNTMPDVSVDELRKSFQTKCLEQNIFTEAKLSKNGKPVTTSSENFGRTTELETVVFIS